MMEMEKIGLRLPIGDPDLINRHATRFRLITLLGEGHEKEG